jgi:hypothetical protein
MHEVPPPTGYYGKTIAVETPSGFVPRFLAQSVYGPLQVRARSEMKANLFKLLH